MSTSAAPRRALVAGTAAAAIIGAGMAPALGAPQRLPAGENGWVTSTLARMTLEEKVGQLFVQYA